MMQGFACLLNVSSGAFGTWDTVVHSLLAVYWDNFWHRVLKGQKVT